MVYKEIKKILDVKTRTGTMNSTELDIILE